ncbi:MAG: hypothetical protein HY716_18675 [Planctomycetes bacterium]|nr:hypothetical protein [Planctomycetota bacterium]
MSSIAFVFCVATASSAAPPQDLQQHKPWYARTPSSWSYEMELSNDFVYSDNVFALDHGSASRLEDGRADDRASGRFDDMESVEEFRNSTRWRLDAAGRSPFGLRAGLWIETAFHLQTQNPVMNHLTAAFGARQGISSGGELGIAFRFLPDLFEKNYLSNASDANGDEAISDDERVYSAGRYREIVLELEYRHHLLYRPRQSLREILAIARVERRDRTYDPPFAGRDEEALGFALGLEVAYESLGVALQFEHAPVDADVTNEVLIFNEFDVGIDFNGDGDVADPNARGVTPVDRGHSVDEVSLTVKYVLGSSTMLGLEYLWRRRAYDSDLLLDVEHRDREDIQHIAGLSLDHWLSRRWKLRLGYERAQQEATLAAPPAGTGETLDYRRHVLYLSLLFTW